jgi:hypothetical protein
MVTPGDVARTDGGSASHRTDGPACDLYVPGHLVHDIQATKSWESGERGRWGRFERVDDGYLVVRFLDGTGRYRIHRPAEVGRVAEPGDKVRVSERWRIATISRRFEHVLTVSIALPRDPWRPCTAAPDAPGSPDDLAGRLAGRGGFSVPGPVATQLAGPGPDGRDDLPPDGDLSEVS